jgi:hypothetical protein
MSIPLDASFHAGDRSFERDVDYRLAKDTVEKGSSKLQKGGLILHERRDPNNIDHVIKVVTTPHPKKIITVIRDTTRPFAEEKALAKAKAGEEGVVKSSKDKSKANRKAQLEKKRARTPKPKNK